jgi:hypothetical protein
LDISAVPELIFHDYRTIIMTAQTGFMAQEWSSCFSPPSWRAPMPKRFIHAVIAAIKAFHSDWKTSFLRPLTHSPRPVWDNGTNYDIPTFLRRRTG